MFWLKTFTCFISHKFADLSLVSLIFLKCLEEIF